MPAWLLRVRRLALGVLCCALLASCGAAEEAGTGGAPDSATRPAEGTSGAGPSSGVAGRAAAEVDEASIREDLGYLTGASAAPLADGPSKISDRGSEEGRRAAAEYVRGSFEELGIPARIIEFDSGGRHGYNVEATLGGSLAGTGEEKHLWVTAHMDTFYVPGAEDDGSGLVSVLMTAKALRNLELAHTVHFVAYDLEEVGLVGSTIYVGDVVDGIRDREGERAIIGNLHSDMIGYDAGGRQEAVMSTCGRAGGVREAVLRAAEEIGSSIALSEDCLGRSDHQIFWEAGLPAMVMTDGSKYDSYPWYHDPNDTIDKLDIPYLRSMIQLNAAAAALLASEEEGRA